MDSLKPIPLLLSVLAILLTTPRLPAGGALPPPEKFVPGEVLVRMKPGKEPLFESTVRTQGFSVKKRIDRIGFKLIKLPQGTSVDQAIKKLKGHPSVEYVGPNHRIRIADVPQKMPNDPVFYYGDELLGMPQWGLYNDGLNNGWGGGYRCDIHAPEAWYVTTGNPDIIIANIDTGIYEFHEDLSGKVLPGYNAIDGSNDTMDDNGHGTFTSGISAAYGDNWVGIAGVAWGCKLLPVKVLDASGYGTEADGAEGIIWAVDHGAKVLNMSFATDINEPALEAAIEYAWQNGCISICASGNENVGTPMYPAAYEHVLAVGASNEFDQRCTASDWGEGGSNYGDHLDCVAPGSWITSTWYDTLFGETYFPNSGTSAAAPFVSGVAALVWSVHPNWTNEQVMAHIKATCDDIAPAGWDIYTGWGRVNAHTAVSAGVAELPSLGRAAALPDGTLINGSGKVVTAGTGHIQGRVYIEDEDRTAGIMISFPQGVPSGLALGDRVSFSGRLSMLDGERAIVNATVTRLSGGPALAPVGMTNTALGGGAIGYNPGITGQAGLCNIGQLVRVWGIVTASPSPSYPYFYIDDGSGVDDGSGLVGLKVECGTLAKPARNKYVSVTGISGAHVLPDGTIVRVLRVRKQGDIQIIR